MSQDTCRYGNQRFITQAQYWAPQWISSSVQFTPHILFQTKCKKGTTKVVSIHVTKAYRTRQSYESPPIIILGTRWKWEVNFTLRPLHPPGKNTGWPLNRMPGWAPQPVWDALEMRPSECTICDFVTHQPLYIKLTTKPFYCISSGQTGDTTHYTDLNHHYWTVPKIPYKTGHVRIT